MILPRIRRDLRQLPALVSVVRRHHPNIFVIVPIRIRRPIARKRQLRPIRRPRRPRIIKIPARHLLPLLARQIKNIQMRPPVIQIPNLIRLKLQSIDHPRLRRLRFLFLDFLSLLDLLNLLSALLLPIAILRRLQLIPRRVAHHQRQPLRIRRPRQRIHRLRKIRQLRRLSPSRFSNQTCVVPPFRADKNANHFPSGLHSGCPDETPSAVSAIASPPANGTIQIRCSSSSFASDVVVTVYATHFPSGEIRGPSTGCIANKSSNVIALNPPPFCARTAPPPTQTIANTITPLAIHRRIIFISRIRSPTLVRAVMHRRIAHPESARS